MIITLCGFMGAGKSTIGRNLALLAGCQFIDLDKEIEATSECSISYLFSNYGERVFRKIEYDTLSKILEDSISESENFLKEDYIQKVISLGGGTLTNVDSTNLIKENSCCYYLKCTNNLLAKRLIKNHIHRPLLDGKTPEEIKEYINITMQNREQVYISTAKKIIECDNKTISQICEEILDSN